MQMFIDQNVSLLLLFGICALQEISFETNAGSVTTLEIEADV